MLGTSGKYRLDTRLGGGGMAEVFLGSMLGAEGFSRRVAIKRVLPGYSDNPSFARMFVAEAQISSRLQHPNIVSVLDFDRDADGRLFLVMEHVDGRDLDALCASGPLPLPVIIFVISEVLRGLGHAHDLPSGTELRGIVHRDVSPHNVLLSWAGAVKVSDFGIAKARQASEVSASVFIKGKPAYMSPEQANGQPLDGRSDLFAVGLTLRYALVGGLLYPDLSGLKLLQAMTRQPIPPLDVAVSPIFGAWLGMLLAREPEDRPGSAAGALQVLRAMDTGKHPVSWELPTERTVAPGDGGGAPAV